MRRLLILLAFIAAPAWAKQECRDIPVNITGLAVAVDGAEMNVLTEGAAGDTTYRVRLWPIRAPAVRDKASDIEQAMGMQSRSMLADFLHRGENRVSCRTTPPFEGCTVLAYCTVTPANGVALTLSESMLAAGFAYLDPTYAATKAGPRTFVEFERQAREARRGHWRIWLPEHR